MQISNLRMFILCVVCGFIQIVINNTTGFYVDIIGALMVVLLFNPNYSLKSLILLALFADLIGIWYLGSHLVAGILLSFLVKTIMNFYNMCAILQKTIIMIIAYSCLYLILFVLGVIYNNWLFEIKSYALDAFIIMPLVFYTANALKSPIKSSLFND